MPTPTAPPRIRRSYRMYRLSEHTKTKTPRIIPMSDDVYYQLKKILVARTELKLKGEKVHDAVFMHKGERLAQGAFRNCWKRVLVHCGIEYRKPHNIRHTVATRLMTTSFPIKIIAALLGHNVQTLLSTCTHQAPGDEDLKRDMVNAMKVTVETNQLTDYMLDGVFYLPELLNKYRYYSEQFIRVSLCRAVASMRGRADIEGRKRKMSVF